MADFNQAIILGNITRDPELRYTPNNQAVISFSVATNRRWTNQQGQPQEDTEFHNVVAWGKLAEICNQILYKGRKVLVSGRLKTRNWEGQDGVKRYTTEIIADNVCATGVNRGGNENQTNPQNFQNASKPQTNNQNDSTLNKNIDNKPKDDINLDDIPF